MILDGILAAALPILAWRVLAARDTTKSIVLFIALGLLSAVAWTRLDAPDIALVEAAVGTGLTGALLIGTFRAIGTSPRASVTARGSRLALALLAVAIAICIEVALLRLPADDPGLGVQVRAAESGVGHPITAVLLDLRGYDTLLEIAVLIVAVLAAQASDRRSGSRAEGPTRELATVLVRLLVPGIILVAGYLLWRGADAPGGAFQAAALLAGGGVLAILAGTIERPDPSAAWVRAVLLLGPLVFVTIAAAPLLGGGRLLEYPDGWAGPLIVTIELALTFSIALVLVMFFPALPPRAQEERA